MKDFLKISKVEKLHVEVSGLLFVGVPRLNMYWGEGFFGDGRVM